MDPNEEIVRLLAIQLRRQSKNQAEAIEELAKSGFGRGWISELLGTTPNTVNQALVAARKRAEQKGRRQKASRDGSKSKNS